MPIIQGQNICSVQANDVHVQGNKTYSYTLLSPKIFS